MIEFEQSVDWILGLIAAIWLIGLILEFKFRIKRWRMIRLGLWSIAMFSIAWYYLQPYTYVEREKEKGVLTGVNTSIPDSLIGYQPIKGEAELLNNSYSQLKLIDTLLQPWHLQNLRADEVTISHQEIKGLINFKTPSFAQKGQEVSIEILTNYDDAISLHLLLGEELLTSTKSEGGHQQWNTLRFTPVASGNFTYTLMAILEDDTVGREVIPLVVENGDQPKVLMLQSYPNFEARFIKNYLGDYGYEVSSRTRISRELFNVEFINTPRKSLDRLTQQKLEQHQILILDKEAYDQLSYREKQTIKELNEVGNMGLLVLNTSPSEMEGIWDRNYRSTSNEVNISGLRIPMQRINSDQLTAITIDTQPIGYLENHGIGNIGWLAAENLYQLSLQGNLEVYERIINRLITVLLPYQKNQRYVQFDGLPVKNERVSISFVSLDEHPTIAISGVTHPIRESAYRANLFETTIWPSREGWNQLTFESNTITHSFYVFGETDWTSKRQTELLTYNQSFIATRETNSSAFQLQEKSFWSSWIFLITFLLSMGMLWAEQRFINP
ncbi:hypothetical protein [Marinoscillum sp.]|uniref:hypothetical protein n=1 Tax=Marinoscillum sp. TaxID=2024838 RepID=UPI003BA9B95A